jgi:hypothetical protein
VQISAHVTGSQREETASPVGRVVGDPESTPRAWRRDLAIVDGMDAMRWEGGVPELEALRSVIDLLQARRVTPHIVLSLDVCRTPFGAEGDLRAFRRLLARDVNIDLCPSNKTVAAWVIELAGDLGAPIVSNDPYHAWPNARDFPRL